MYFEMTKEQASKVAKHLLGRTIIDAKISFYGIELKLDDGTTLKYWNQSSDYENWGATLK